MTWGDIFRRLVMVLRSRLSRHRVCGECGWLLTPTRHVGIRTIYYKWHCEDCQEQERLKRAEEDRQLREAEVARILKRREQMFVPAAEPGEWRRVEADRVLWEQLTAPEGLTC
jgi:hypothetical protein